MASRPLTRLSRATSRLLDDALLVVAAHRDLQRLARLDDRALRDIGITRFEAERLARRSIWTSLFAVSFFEVRYGRIVRAEEYFADNSPPPHDRSAFAERY